MRGYCKKTTKASITASIFACSFLLLAAEPELYAQGTQGSPSSPNAPGANYTPNPRAVSLYNLGLTAHKQGSPESAIIFFKRACDIDPNLADAQYNLGVLYQMQKRFKEAIPRFEEVLRIKPSDPDAHFQLGCILQDAGRVQEARQHLSAIAPNNAHFSEAQRRIALLNSGQPGGTDMSQQPQANQTASAQTPNQSLQSYPPSSQSIGGLSTQNPGAEPNITNGNNQQSIQNPAGYNVQFHSTPGQPSQSQTPAQNELPATTYIPQGTSQAPSSGGPVPVLPNSSLRVIATGFSAPSGLAFDRNGNLYVANYMTNSIDRIGPDGTRNTFCTGVNLRGPIGLIVDDLNNLYVANYNGGTVVKVSPAGISSIVASGLRQPYYLTLDRDGNLYVSQQADNSIVRISLPRALGANSH